jgi:DNA-binding LacI/PurR family transcriptional regulator
MHIRSFAKISGVSIATVSRAFDPNGVVKAETRERILSLAAQHGFTPNIHAQRMSSRQSSVLGIFYSFSDEPIFDYYNMELAQQLAFEASKAGFTAQLELSSSAEQQRKHLRQLVENRSMGGIILVAEGELSAKALLAGTEDCPSVVISTTSWPNSPTMGIVHLNVAPGIDLALTQLRQGNHTKIGYIRGKADATKLAAYQNFMKRKGLVVEEGWITPACSSFSDGGRLAVDLARRGVSAILCATDILALGALHSLTASGFQVPGDISLVGIDDLAFSSYVTPALSSIGVPRGQLAQSAVEILTRVIRDNREGNSLPQYLSTVNATYISRGSTQALPSSDEPRP